MKHIRIVMMRWQSSVLVLTAAALAGSAYALETDQYFAWGRHIADSTDAVNAKVNLELERSAARLSDRRPPESCVEVSADFRSRMRFLLLHEIQIWAWNSEWVDRIPNGGEEQRLYRRTNLYSNHSVIDVGTWMPFSPTIKVAGIRIGTDKLSHFVSSGWTYYSEYRKAVENGASPEEAERRAVRRGLIEESLVLGGKSSGVLALSDAEASFGGLQFYRDLCDGDDPVLQVQDGVWRMTRQIDLGDYVTPRWDESFQPPVYSKSRWRKVRPVLESYCGLLDDPQVVEMRRRYRSRDRQTVVAEVVAERIAAGKLADPETFGLEAVCSEPDPSLVPGPEPRGLMSDSEHENKIPPGVEEIRTEEENRRRFALGLFGVHVTYPQVVSASVAVMLTSQPVSYDCTTPCDFRGPFAELEPGLGGGKLSLGWGRVSGTTNRKGDLLRAAYIGAAFTGTVLRTWGQAGWVEGGRTYVGFEFGIPVAQAALGIGLLYRVDSGIGGRWLVTGSAGWGF